MWICRSDFLDIYNRLRRLGGHPPSKSHGIVTREQMDAIVDAFDEVHGFFPLVPYSTVTSSLAEYNFRHMLENLDGWEAVS